jgi:hypothetical protein
MRQTHPPQVIAGSLLVLCGAMHASVRWRRLDRQSDRPPDNRSPGSADAKTSVSPIA